MKQIKNFSTIPSISGWLLKIAASLALPKIIINALTFCFLIKYKICNIIMKTEPTKIVHEQRDRWTSYDVIKNHVVNTNVTLK